MNAMMNRLSRLLLISVLLVSMLAMTGCHQWYPGMDIFSFKSEVNNKLLFIVSRVLFFIIWAASVIATEKLVFLTAFPY